MSGKTHSQKSLRKHGMATERSLSKRYTCDVDDGFCSFWSGDLTADEKRVSKQVSLAGAYTCTIETLLESVENLTLQVEQLTAQNNAYATEIGDLGASLVVAQTERDQHMAMFNKACLELNAERQEAQNMRDAMAVFQSQLEAELQSKWVGTRIDALQEGTTAESCLRSYDELSEDFKGAEAENAKCDEEDESPVEHHSTAPIGEVLEPPEAEVFADEPPEREAGHFGASRGDSNSAEGAVPDARSDEEQKAAVARSSTSAGVDAANLSGCPPEEIEEFYKERVKQLSAALVEEQARRNRVRERNAKAVSSMQQEYEGIIDELEELLEREKSTLRNIERQYCSQECSIA